MLNLLTVFPYSPGNKQIVFLPMGLSQLIAVMEQQGHLVTNLDMHNKRLPPEAVLGPLGRQRVDVCLLSGFATQVYPMREIVALVRAKSPHTRVVLGGVGVSDFPEEMLAYTGADVVVSGEAEEVIQPLLSCLEAGVPPVAVPSLTYRDDRGRVVKNPMAPPPADLDALPMPAHHHFDVDFIARHGYHGGRRSLPMITSRGCPFRCTFCIQSVKGNMPLLTEIHGEVQGHKSQYTRMRYRDPARVMAEARHLKERYQVDLISFSDEEVLASNRHLAAVCNVMGELGLSYIASGRADLMTREKAQWLKESGCQTFYFGVESASQKILDSVNKNAKVEKISEGIRAAQAVGLNFYSNFIIGLPAETPETVQESLRFCKEHRLEYAATYYTMFPNSLLMHQNRHRIGDWEAYLKKLSDGTFAWEILTNLTTMSDGQLRYWHGRGWSETAAHRLVGAWGGVAEWLLQGMLHVAFRVLKAIPMGGRMWIRNLWYYRPRREK